ncbi:UNVERIFIED_CONTAM: hypothetical protein GTU68_048281 [Idotea baltica]|nr:hypothetical protein [Idotea baltica]
MHCVAGQRLRLARSLRSASGPGSYLRPSSDWPEPISTSQR